MKIEIPEVFSELTIPKRYKVFYGGRGAGRSWSFARVLLLMGAQRKLRILCAREYQKSIADSVHRLLSDQIEMMGISGAYKITDTYIQGTNGTEFIFAGLKHNARNIKSIESVDICWVEEAEKVSDESWNILIPTIRKRGSEIWVSFNTGLEDDPTYRRFVANTPHGSVVRLVNSSDNKYLTDELKAEREFLKRVDYDAYCNVWLGEPLRYTDSMVFKGRIEVAEFEPPKDVKFFYGADWGFANDPTVLLRCWIDSGKLWIDHEAYGVGVKIDKLQELFSNVPLANQHTIRADCARPELVEYMKRHGFPRIESASKWDGSVKDGVDFLRTFEKIVVHDRCPNAAQDLKRYSFKRNAAGDILPDVAHDYSHTPDALRYALAPMVRKNEYQHFYTRV